MWKEVSMSFNKLGKMEILREEEIEEYKCPKCKRILQFSHNEMKETWKLKLALFPWTDPTTGNGWFECEDCNRTYLIKDYARKLK
jgi:uncharacterized protein YbaR (Trm112 family)